VRSPDVRLILQPMSRVEILRDYLDKQGFAVREERLVRTDRVYQIICAEYDGKVRSHPPLALLLGEQNMARRDALCLEHARRQREILTASREGKRKGANPDTSREDVLLTALDDFLSQETED
jgi:tRNA A22 N-methylase